MMRLKELPDWPKSMASLTSDAVLKSAKPSQLRHFVILDFEKQGIQEIKLVEVGAHSIDKVLAVLNRHIGRSLDEINDLEIND
jgi:hypothetical protein